MNVSSAELITVLRQYNPWWRGASPADLPTWRRRAFHDILGWMVSPPAPRALLLSGTRQVGKTTLFLQVIQALIEDGVPAIQDFSILPLSFDVDTGNGVVPARIAKIPAPLACYWLGKTEMAGLSG